MTDHVFADNPFAKKKKPNRYTSERAMVKADMSGTAWEGCEEFIPMCFTIGRKFGAVYGRDLGEQVESDLLSILPQLSKSYVPDKGTKRAYFSFCLGMRARYVMRRYKEQASQFVQLGTSPTNNETESGDKDPVDKYTTEGQQLMMDFDEFLSKLNPVERWFVEMYYVYQYNLEQITVAYNRNKPKNQKLSRATIHRRVEAAAGKVIDVLREWKDR